MKSLRKSTRPRTTSSPAGEPSDREEAARTARRFGLSVTTAVCVLVVASVGAAEVRNAPQALSPAGTSVSPALASSCPTFSWAVAGQAEGYELVVLRAKADGEANAATRLGEARLGDTMLDGAQPSLDEGSLDVALRQRLPAGAASWTPDLRSCLEPGGRYVWSIRALGPHRGAEWSEPVWLDVEPAPSPDEIEHALAVLRRHRASISGARASIDEPLDTPAPVAVARRSTRETVPGGASFEPLRSASVGPRVAAAANAPTIASASLAVSQQVHLAEGSAVFKNGELFLWDGIKQFYGPQGTTAVGRGALALNASTGYDYSAISNTAVGFRSLAANTTGFFNTATGATALRSNTTGQRNTALGARALYFNSTGIRNTALGTGSLFTNYSGADNTAVGWEALVNAEGSRNIGLGYRAGENLQIFGSDNVLIHSKGVYSESHTLRIGQASGSGPFELGSAFIHGINGASVNGDNESPVLIDATGKLGTMVSSSRFKQDITDIDELSERLLELRPVSFRYRSETGRGGQALQFGLIAEEVAEVFPELVGFDESGRPLSVKYHLMTALLLDLLQEQHRADALLREEVAALRERVARLRPPASSSER